MNKFINTVRAIIMFALLFVILVFCFQNRDEVDIHFISIHVQQVPLFIALFGTLATGLLIGFLGGMISGTKSNCETLRNPEEESEVKKQASAKDFETND